MKKIYDVDFNSCPELVLAFNLYILSENHTEAFYSKEADRLILDRITSQILNVAKYLTRFGVENPIIEEEIISIEAKKYFSWWKNYFNELLITGKIQELKEAVDNWFCDNSVDLSVWKPSGEINHYSRK